MLKQFLHKGMKGFAISLLLALVAGFGMVDNSWAISGEGHPWTHGDWSSRVAWEARYALSQSSNGTSGTQTSYGNRNYVASDWYAYNKAATEAGWVVGTVGNQKGGWCTFFVRLVLFRSTYWTGYGDHLTTPQYPDKVYANVNSGYMTNQYGSVQPGWIFISSDKMHYAIADSRALINGQWGWWFIDSNYVGGNGNFYIGRHFMPDGKLSSDNYWAWYPSQATLN